MTATALPLFEWMYKLYCSEDGVMTAVTTRDFIRGCTGESVPVTDSRIKNLFTSHCKAKNDQLLESEFVGFFTTACLGSKDKVYENLRQHNIGKDFVRHRDRIIKNPLKKFDMPRQSMSSNDETF